MKFKIALLFLFLIIGGFLFYWFEIRPSEIIKSCHARRIEEIQNRHSDNLNYYFVPSTGIPNLDKDIDAGVNKPMYVKDQNARLDMYWGDIFFKNCLNLNGMLEK